MNNIIKDSYKDAGSVPDIMLKSQRNNLAQLNQDATTFTPVQAGIAGMSIDEIMDMQKNMVEDMSGERPLIMASEIDGVANEPIMAPAEMTARIATLEFQVRMLLTAVNRLKERFDHE